MIIQEHIGSSLYMEKDNLFLEGKDPLAVLDDVLEREHKRETILEVQAEVDYDNRDNKNEDNMVEREG